MQAAKYLLKLRDKKVNFNEGKDIKLQADIESEKIIINILQEKFDYPILTEEMGGIGDICTNKKRWIVDPIDGTLNFSRDLPICCISIALYEGTEPIMGVIYDFNRREMFCGVVGIGAWLNNKPIRLSNIADRTKAIIATGFPVYMEHNEATLLEFVSFVREFKKVRLLGSAALSLAYVACGRVDVYYENEIKIWDVAAGIAIVKSLGGYVRIDHGKSQYGLNIICSCNTKVTKG